MLPLSGADPVNDRHGFAQMLERLLSNGARTLLVESPDRFARDLMLQLAGHDMLKARGISLIAASAPTFFIEDTPTAVLVRQVLGAVAQFEKATTVAKLAAARRRKRITTGEKVEGRKSHAELRPDVVKLAKGARSQEAKGREAEPARDIRRTGRARRPQRTRAPVQPEIRLHHADWLAVPHDGSRNDSRMRSRSASAKAAANPRPDGAASNPDAASGNRSRERARASSGH
jgi:DNA invertase Pin-like site-specific DNA recombinase